MKIYVLEIVLNETDDYDVLEGTEATLNPSPYDDSFLFRRLL